MSKIDLFLELAQPDPSTGISRWVYAEEFKDKYSALKLGNGGSWCRGNGSLQKKYVVRLDKSLTIGNKIDRIRLDGYRADDHFNQHIRSDIKEGIRQQKCVMMGVKGISENTTIEVDHKDGRKDDIRVSNLSTQQASDFQPLCGAANKIKREICRKCKATGIRWDAKNIKGNPFSFYAGDCHYTEKYGCEGCYQYDPVAYRKWCVKKLLEEQDPGAYNKIFPEG